MTEQHLPRRATSRWITGLALLALGGVAAWRLPLSYLPERSFPELQVELRLPEPGELDEVSRQWITPLESAIRSTGGVRSTAGEVNARGGRLRIRFHGGVDLEAKAARLESELGAYRRSLPWGARLDLAPASQARGGDSAVVWLAGGETMAGDHEEEGVELQRVERRLRRIERRLQALPEVRGVELGGVVSRELVVRARQPWLDPQRLEKALDHELSMYRLGSFEHGGRERSVWVDERRGGGLGASVLAPVAGSVASEGGPVPLASLADLRLETPDPAWSAHYDGRAGAVLFINREEEASPLVFRHAIRRLLVEEGVSGDAFHFLVDEARPLARLLGRLALGLAAAMVVLALLGGWLGGWRMAASLVFVVPVGLASAFQGLWLVGEGLDVSTLPALAIALAGALVAWSLPRRKGSAWFSGWVSVVSVATVPVTIALAGGVLAPVLDTPGRVLLVAFASALLGMAIVPRHVPCRPLPWLGRGTAKMLRAGATVVLLTITLVYGLLLSRGKVLAPTTGELPMAALDLLVSLRFAEGSTLEQARQRLTTVEQHLRTVSEIEGFWSVYGRWGGSLGLTLDPSSRRRNRLRPLVRRLEAELGGLGSSVVVRPFAGGATDSRPLRWSESLEDRAEVDPKELFDYTFVLRSTDLPALHRAYDDVMGLLGSKQLDWTHYPDRTTSAWRRPTVQVELSPRPGIDQELTRRALGTVVRRATWPGAKALPGDDLLRLRLLAADGPMAEDDVPQRADLLGLRIDPEGHGVSRPLALGEIFEVRERVASPGLRRQVGRFVLPITLRLRGQILAFRQEAARAVQHRLGRLDLPPGVELERPDLSPFTLRSERLRMVAIAGTLPLLLLAVAICRLDGLGRALAALAAPVAGVAMAALVIGGERGNTDEGSLFALAAALAVVLPVALEAADRGWPRRRSSLAGGFSHRWLTAGAAPMAVAVVGLLVLLTVPTLGQQSDREPWALPLRTAAVTMATACVAGWCLVPLLVAGGQRLRQRDPEARRRRRHPPEWQEPGTLEVSTRNLTKVYGDGFKALSGVDMRLEPGIVGLLGPNGAGKTTLLRLLCGLLEPSRGQVLFRGVPVTPDNLSDYRRLVGFLPQELNAYDGMAAASFLDYWALERGLRDPRGRRREVERVLEQVGLSDVAGRKVRQFSGGMRRRIGIARALLGDPPIVVVDEPTTGLDVESRNRLRETLLSVAGERVILFSTHIAGDIAAAAGRILVLHQGRLRFDGTSSELIERAHGRVFETVVADRELRELSHRYRVSTRVRVRDGIRVRAVTLGDREPAGELVIPNLEEAYLAELGGLEEVSESSSPGKSEQPRDARRASRLLDVEAWRSS